MRQLKESRSNFEDSICEERRDCCVEVVPSHREKFSNVKSVLAESGSSAVPIIETSGTQTDRAMNINTWSQCNLDKESSSEINVMSNKKALKSLVAFLKSKVDDVCYEVLCQL